MKKKLFIESILIVAGLLLAACAAPAAEEAAPVAEEAAPAAEEAAPAEKVSIVYLADNLSDTYMRTVADGLLQFADDNSDLVEVTILDAKADMATQVSDAENAIAQGADAIIIKPVDSGGCETISAAVREASLPFVAVTQDISDVTLRDSYIGTADHLYAGMLEAKYVAEKLGGKGNVVILVGDPGHEVSRNRTDGAVNYLAENYPDIKIIDKQTANWMRDMAIEKTENWLQSDIADDIDAIIANNDEMAIGAVLACEEAGKDDIVIVGVDGLVEGLTYLKEGRMAFTVFQNGTLQGYTAGEVAYGLTQGKTFDSIIDIPYEPVNPEDVDTFLARYK